MIASEDLSEKDDSILRKIETVLDAHQSLSPHSRGLRISFEGTRIVLRGELPSVALKQQLIPAIRQAGVLGQVCNCVEVN